MCAKCSLREERSPASALAISAALIGALSVTCGFLPGLLAIALARFELHRIDRGQSPPGGRGWAQAAQLLGATALLLGLLLAFAVLT